MLRSALLTLSLCLLLPAASFAHPLGTTPSIDPLEVGASELKPGKVKKPRKGKAGKAAKAAEEAAPTPPPDGDADGVPDADDQCPAEAEDVDGHEDADGCPDPDNDSDGINDVDDGCPMEAENKDGWDDEDGCPEAAPAIQPLKLSATLLNGTKLSGIVKRIVATDEDEPKSEPTEPTDIGIVVGEDSEFVTTWDQIRSLKSEKVVFTDAVDCYSEGVQELGDDAATWECTLKHPTVVKLAKSEHKGTHRLLDRKMQRMDFKLDEIECEGDSCEAIEETKTLPLYLYRLIAIEKSDDEYEAVTKLQTRLREMQQLQIKTATLEPLPEAAPAGE